MARAIGNRRDMIMRLHNTVCLYKNEPVKVDAEGCLKENCVNTTRLFDGYELKDVDITQDSFSYSSLKLGYVNYKGKSRYVVRIGRRINRQGIHRDNTRFGHSRMTNEVLFSGSFNNMLQNKYPNLTTCLKKLKSKNTQSVAISRHTSFEKSRDKNVLYIFYKEKKIARWNDFKQWLDNSGSSFFNYPDIQYIVDKGISVYKQILDETLEL